MFVYIIRPVGCETIKIGKAKNVKSRVGDLQIGCPYKLEIIRIFDCKTEKRAYAVERIAHGFLRDYARHGEWFKIPEPNVLSRMLALMNVCSSGTLAANESMSVEEGAVLVREALRRCRRHKVRGPHRFVKSQIRERMA